MPLFRIHSSFPVVLIQAPNQSMAEDYYMHETELEEPTFTVEILDEPIVIDEYGVES
mgnify:CR=1 FL=1